MDPTFAPCHIYDLRWYFMFQHIHEGKDTVTLHHISSSIIFKLNQLIYCSQYLHTYYHCILDRLLVFIFLANMCKGFGNNSSCSREVSTTRKYTHYCLSLLVHYSHQHTLYYECLSHSLNIGVYDWYICNASFWCRKSYILVALPLVTKIRKSSPFPS